MKTLLTALLAFTANCLAATTIEIAVKFADVPAGTEAPTKPELLAKTKGIEVLSAPRVATPSGQSATIEVSQAITAPDGSETPLGVTLSIKPTITEKGSIAFSGKATDRFKHGQRSGETLSVLTCVAREIYFKGVTVSGSTVVLNAGPSTSSSTKKDGATVVKNRELVIYLTFKKITPEPEKKKPEPSKSTKSTKSTAKKKSSKK
jgi:hypothetical protein